jgi:peptide/nickel transport system substrate-binding protein
VARARALFDQVPMPDELVLRTPEYMPDRAPEVSRAVADQLGALGIRVRIEIGTDRPQYARDVGSKKIGHMALFDSTPLSSYRVLQEKISGRHQGVWWQGVKDDVVDRLIEVAHGAIGTASRAAAYAHCLTWLHNHPHWLYLYHPVEFYAHRRGLESVTMTHGGQLRLTPHGI